MTTTLSPRSLLLAASLALPAAAWADERPDHFEGEPAPTLDAALANIAEYNARVAEILAKDALSATDLHTIHELTYTLENALATLDESLDTMAEDLEEVHQASERADADTARSRGSAYLEASNKLVR